MLQDQQLFPLIAILFRLRELCEGGRSGVFAVTTADGQRTEIRLRKGTIVDLRQGQTEGVATLASIAAIQEGRIRFSEEEIRGIGLAVLPPTKDILFLLGLPLEQGESLSAVQYAPGDWSMERLKADAGRLLPLHDIIDMMRFGQSNQLSAVLFFVTTHRQWFEFVFRGGEIVDVASQSAAGLEAVGAFKQAKGAKYGIRLRRCSVATDYDQIAPLPATLELLRFLAAEGLSLPGTPAQEPPPPAPPPAAKAPPPPVALAPRSVAPPSADRAAQSSEEEDKKQGFSPIAEILRRLHELCEEHQTGIMIIVRSDRRGLLEFFVDQGRISDIVCRRQHGAEALKLAKEVTSGRYSFTARRTPARQRDLADLPSNEEIFYQLGLPLETLGIKQEIQEAPPEPEAAPEEQAAKKTVLVVDDSPLTRKIVSKTLLDQGYAVIDAEDGATAVDRVQTEHPDLVLLDLIMPGMDGYEVLSAIRHGSDKIKRTPVILLTSRDKLFNKIRGKMAGSDEYLTKPFKPDELLLKIRKYIG